MHVICIYVYYVSDDWAISVLVYNFLHGTESITTLALLEKEAFRPVLRPF